MQTDNTDTLFILVNYFDLVILGLLDGCQDAAQTCVLNNLKRPFQSTFISVGHFLNARQDDFFMSG